MTRLRLRVALQAKPLLAVRPTALAARRGALTVHLAALAVRPPVLLVTLPVARVAPKQVAPAWVAQVQEKVAGAALTQEALAAKGVLSIRWPPQPCWTSTT